MQDLSSKTIFITGAAGLLGQHFATAFATTGSTVVLTDISDKLEPFAKTLLEKDYKVYYLKQDITQLAAWEKIKDFLQKNNLFCNVLINNACTKSENFFEAFENFSLKEWHEVMAVNVDAAMMACQTLGAIMAKQKQGSIINIASLYGVVAPDQRIYEGSEYLGRSINTPAVYSVSKAALIGLSNYLATYWGAYNVRVNSLTPGGVYSGQNETFVKNYSAKVPLNRMANPQDIVNAAQFLASDKAAYITGQNLIVDGGWTTW